MAPCYSVARGWYSVATGFRMSNTPQIGHAVPITLRDEKSGSPLSVKNSGVAAELSGGTYKWQGYAC
eukprot:scaffold231771_cov31-Tisochrysis_lutea.AAC.2